MASESLTAFSTVAASLNTTSRRRLSSAKADGTSKGTARVEHFDRSAPELFYDFGGSYGVVGLMIGFPLIMWFMWIGAVHYDGQIPSEPGMTWNEFGRHLCEIVYRDGFPHRKAWLIYWGFLISQGIMYLELPGGVYATGLPLEHEGGGRLRYYCNGVTCFYWSTVMACTLHFTGYFRLYTLLDEFGPLLSVSIISGYLVSVVAYFSAIWRGKQHRMTGSWVYDFFMGAELNPRLLGWLDMKMFFEVRLPWFILFFLSLGACLKQYEQYGFVSGELGFVLMAHFLYANACCKGEEGIVVTWDIFHEKWGFMLIFWNMAGVPLTYCHCTIYLANHHPSEYAWSRTGLAAMYLGYLLIYWIWDTSLSQRCFFRAQERGTWEPRKTFPQLPWRRLENPEKLITPTGDSLLLDGWYRYARKIPYACDLYFAVCWALITGFDSPFPWFYPIFFAIMIVHRTTRDLERCRRKYGAFWDEYERRVPYLFIPYVV